MTPLEQRVAAAQATLDHFKDHPFEWGKADCAILCAFLLRRLGISTPLRSFGNYKTAFGAKRALLRKGFHDMPDVLDSLGLQRIAPALALPGDIVGTVGSDGIDTALAIFLGNGRFLGFAEDENGARAGVLSLPVVAHAWRVI